ncbi:MULTISPECIES: hypothetical protein [unclassified Streptomyces]|uniref:hypothetical protein n=1 Tax=unclassified Streptomyces TaxID=2593676 RepID=UPI0035E0A9DA
MPCRPSTATGHPAEAGGLRRLVNPGARDTDAAALLRHPDLLEGIATLYRAQLVELLAVDNTA